MFAIFIQLYLLYLCLYEHFLDANKDYYYYYYECGCYRVPPPFYNKTRDTPTTPPPTPFICLTADDPHVLF